MVRKSLRLFDSALVGQAVADSFRKLSPAVQVRNPVMFVVYIGSILTSVLFVQALRGQGEAPAGFIFAVSAWLWFTPAWDRAVRKPGPCGHCKPFTRNLTSPSLRAVQWT